MYKNDYQLFCKKCITEINNNKKKAIIHLKKNFFNKFKLCVELQKAEKLAPDILFSKNSDFLKRKKREWEDLGINTNMIKIKN